LPGGPGGFPRGFTCLVVFRNISNEFNPFHIQDYHLLWFYFPVDSVREDEFLTHVGSRPKIHPTTPYSAPHFVRSYVEASPPWQKPLRSSLRSKERSRVWASSLFARRYLGNRLARSARISNFQFSISPACRQAGINNQCFNSQVGSLRTHV